MCGNPVVPAPSVKKIIISPVDGLGTLVENQLAKKYEDLIMGS